MLHLALGLAAASLGRDLHTKRCLPLSQTLPPEPVGVRGAPPHCLGGDLLSPQATRLSILHCWACSRGPHPLSKCIAPAPLPPADGVPRTRLGFEGIHKSPPPQRVSFIHLEGWPHGRNATALAPGPMLRDPALRETSHLVSGSAVTTLEFSTPCIVLLRWTSQTLEPVLILSTSPSS